MKINKYWKIAAGGIAGLFLLFIILFALVIFLPNSWINSALGGKGSTLIGREFAVDGDVKIDWDWNTPKVHLGKIRLANIEGSPDKNMIEIETLDFHVKLWKLLIGRLEMPDLEIGKPKIVLEKTAQGERNWDFPALSKSNVAANAAIPSDRHDFPLIGNITISDGVFVYRDGEKKLDLTLTLDTVKGGGIESEQTFELNGDGKLQDQIFNIKATGGSLNNLRDSTKDYPLNLALAMGKTKISFVGTFKDPVQLMGISAHLDVEGSNMADLFHLTGIPLPPTPPYKLSGTLQKDDDLWAFNDFQGKVGGSDLSGNMKYNVSKERGFMSANLVSNVLAAEDLGGFIGLAPPVKNAPELSAEQKAQAKKQAQSAKALPDVPISLDRLRTTDMDVTLNAKDIRASGWPLNSLDVRIMLENGILKVEPMTLGMADGTVDGNLILDGSKDIPDVKMDLNLKKLSLKQFFSDSRFESFSAGHFGGRIQLAGQGKSLADVLGSSDGHVTVSMSGGKISLLIVEAAGIDLMELAPRLLGDDKNTNIRCAVGDFDVKNGLLKSNILVFDTSDSNIDGEAKINLKNESLDIHAESHPKDQSLLSMRTPIVISGTLKNPSIGLDPKELGARGAGAAVLSVFLTPLAAVIPFIELGLGEDSDCHDLISQAKASSAATSKKMGD